uniref:Zinc transporter, putative n=1 Tax=Asparagus officinalis TaxID=4686 RepID=Q2XNV5_ASPOF|nr:zinc transporter, putative [Asparagus officinalis]
MAKSSVFFLTLLSIALSAAAHGGGSDHDGDGSDADSPNLRSKSLILVKIWCLIIVFFGTFVGGVSPYFLKWNEGFLVLGTQFAGGVFLGTAMMHFLSDSNETFGDLTEKEYPFAFMLASAGYVITMLADCVISNVVLANKGVRDVERGNVAQDKVDSNSTKPHSQPEGPHGGAHNQSVEYVLSHASSLGDSILLIVALCFHSVFEGIAIGVAENKADAWKALWTISLHKIFAAIAMGIALLRMIPDRPLISCAAYAFAFAISSPVGVAIGIIIDATTEGHVADWIFAISMGIACGIFIYVAINHLLAKGYQPQQPVAVNTPIAYRLGVKEFSVVVAEMDAETVHFASLSISAITSLSEFGFDDAGLPISSYPRYSETPLLHVVRRFTSSVRRRQSSICDLDSNVHRLLLVSSCSWRPIGLTVKADSSADMDLIPELLDARVTRPVNKTGSDPAFKILGIGRDPAFKIPNVVCYSNEPLSFNHYFGHAGGAEKNTVFSFAFEYPKPSFLFGDSVKMDSKRVSEGNYKWLRTVNNRRLFLPNLERMWPLSYYQCASIPQSMNWELVQDQGGVATGHITHRGTHSAGFNNFMALKPGLFQKEHHVGELGFTPVIRIDGPG